MALKGFDPRWSDFPDYIIGITREIWEGRDIASLRGTYASDIVLRTPSGVSRGNEPVIANTMAVLHEFPDRQLLADDVIWSGDATRGYLSSHRLLNTAVHRGDGEFGPATGKQLVFYGIADCAAKNGVIDDEWLVRDRGAIVRQLGMEPKQFAADEIERQGGARQASRPFTPDQDVTGPYQGRGNDDSWGSSYERTIEALMRADFSAVRRNYDRAVQLQTPGGKSRIGHAGVDAFWLSLRSALPSAIFSVHHRIGRDDPHRPPRAALRWSLTGTHDGNGMFGVASGAPVHVMGMSHAEFSPYGIKREFIMIDEVAIWKQILLHTG